MSKQLLKSPIWEYFVIYEEDTSKARCKVCEKLISRGGTGKKASTTPLYGHLRSVHGAEHDSLTSESSDKTKVKVKQITTTTKHTKHAKQDRGQPSVQGYMEKRKIWDINDTRAVKVHYKIGEMIALDNQPYTIVHNQGFVRLMAHALPSYSLPSRNYFTNKIIPDIYTRLQTKISDSIEKAEYLSLTSDIWTCQENNSSFISMTGHWLEPKTLVRYNAVLNCEHFTGSHTGVHIGEKIEYMLESWNISKTRIHILVRDGGANMVKGCNETGIDSLSCFIHSCQLVVIDALKSQRAVMDAISVARKIVTHFSHSSLACGKLKQIQDDLIMTNKKLIQDVQTRWNSTYYMLERLYEQKRCIGIYANENDKITNLTKTQWDLIGSLINILKPFEELTRHLSSTQSCISDIIPSVMMLNKCFQQIAPFGLGTMLQLHKRFSDIEDNRNCSLATILDPRYKTAFFSDQNTIDSVKHTLLLEGLKCQKKTVDDDSASGGDGNISDSAGSDVTVRSNSTTRSNSPIKRRKESIFDCYKEIIKTQTSEPIVHATESRSISQQIEDYLTSPLTNRESDPILYWREKQITFPDLTKLVLRYLSAPPSSVYSERTFSEAGNIYEDRRNRLTPRNAEKLLFIHHNLPKVGFDY